MQQRSAIIVVCYRKMVHWLCRSNNRMLLACWTTTYVALHERLRSWQPPIDASSMKGMIPRQKSQSITVHKMFHADHTVGIVIMMMLLLPLLHSLSVSSPSWSAYCATSCSCWRCSHCCFCFTNIQLKPSSSQVWLKSIVVAVAIWAHDDIFFANFTAAVLFFFFRLICFDWYEIVGKFIVLCTSKCLDAFCDIQAISIWVTLSFDPSTGNSHASSMPVRLPPLIPSPLPDSQQDTVEDRAGQDQYDCFRCSIHMEFIRDPCGCSQANCQSRFCYSCLSGVATGVPIGAFPLNYSPASGSQDGNKCPVCRSQLRLQDIQQDRELHLRIALPTIKFLMNNGTKPSYYDKISFIINPTQLASLFCGTGGTLLHKALVCCC